MRAEGAGPAERLVASGGRNDDHLVACRAPRDPGLDEVPGRVAREGGVARGHERDTHVGSPIATLVRASHMYSGTRTCRAPRTLCGMKDASST